MTAGAPAEQLCWAEPPGDLAVDDAEGVAERGRGRGLVAGHERAQDAVVHLGVEDREAQAVAGEGVQVAVRDAGDEPVAGQAGQVVGGLVVAVGGAEQAGHQGAQALVRDAGDGVQRAGEGAGQGHDSRVTEPQSRGPPAILREGGLRYPRKGWTIEDTSLADFLSLQQPGVDRTCPGLEFGEVVQAASAAEVNSGALTTVSTRRARPSFKYCFTREWRQNALMVTPWQLRSIAVRNVPPAWSLGLRPRGSPLNKISKCSGRPRSRLSATSASKNARACRGAPNTIVRDTST